MTRKMAVLTALSMTIIGCSGSEPPPQAECRSFSSKATRLLGRADSVKRLHDRWREQLPSAQPPYTRAHAAESAFRESCQRLGEQFDEAATELRHAARSDSPLMRASVRAARAGQSFSLTCIDLVQGNIEGGDDRQGREALLRSAIDELRQASEEVRAACEAPSE